MVDDKTKYLAVASKLRAINKLVREAQIKLGELKHSAAAAGVYHLMDLKIDSNVGLLEIALLTRAAEEMDGALDV